MKTFTILEIFHSEDGELFAEVFTNSNPRLAGMFGVLLKDVEFGECAPAAWFKSLDKAIEVAKQSVGLLPAFAASVAV